MIDVNELRKGTTFKLEGNIYKVLEYSHHKPGRGKATIRVEVRDLRSGIRLKKKFNSGDSVQDIRLTYRNAKFLYRDGDTYHFMDTETYEQPALRGEALGDATKFLQEDMEVKLTFYQGEPLDIDLPTTVDQKVVRADPSVRGNTATSVTKSVTTEGGVEVDVPNFVEEGDIIRVDTRSGEYVTRV
ncbi:MAG: elongation factor P [Anaerolineales bacterium]|nr:elongation factor P [Anaerolineales bacterium]MBS3751839.1 elongation factor P [Anaerolineales bacterium]